MYSPDSVSNTTHHLPNDIVTVVSPPAGAGPAVQRSQWQRLFVLTILLLAFGTGRLLAQTTESDAAGIQTDGVPVRIKDIAYIRGVRENQLAGLGLVAGLAGKGDSPASVPLQKSMANMFSAFGLGMSEDEIKSKNCALVLVTADVPGFVRPGDRIDVAVSSLGDAKSLEGGVLLQASMRGANGNIYAAAQGPITLDSAGPKTVGSVPKGGLIEREILSEFIGDGAVNVILHSPDFTTARAVTTGINKRFPEAETETLDASVVRVGIPQGYEDDPIGFISEVEKLEIVPDFPGRVVINQRSGVVVMGKGVKIGQVAVSYDGGSVSVGSNVSSGFFGSDDEAKESFVLTETVSADEFVSTLQELGIKTDTIIEILKAIDRAGALFGTLTFM